MTRPVESAAVREEIARALRLDLVGPWAGHPLADERLPGWVRPSNWYLTGFLAPRGAPIGQRGDADVDDQPEVAERAGLGDDSTEDRRAAKKGFFPSSMGLSFLVGEGVETLEVLVRWGDYRRIEAVGGDQNRDGAVPDGETEAGRDRQQTAGERAERAPAAKPLERRPAAPRPERRSAGRGSAARMAEREPAAKTPETTRRQPASTKPAGVRSGAGGNAPPAPNRSG